MITITIQRTTLQRLKACKEGLALYDTIAALQAETDARRGKRLRLRFTPLHCVWLAAAYPGFAAWIRDHNLVPLLSLAHAHLTGANLTGANLTGAHLTGAHLTGANLAHAHLAGADLAGANLAGVDLTGANLARAYLTRAYLTGANLTGANLAGANLAGVDLTGVDLTGANLAYANLTRAHRSPYDAPIAGWRRDANGYLERDTPQASAPARTNGAAAEVQP